MTGQLHGPRAASCPCGEAAPPERMVCGRPRATATRREPPGDAAESAVPAGARLGDLRPLTVCRRPCTGALPRLGMPRTRAVLPRLPVAQCIALLLYGYVLYMKEACFPALASPPAASSRRSRRRRTEAVPRPADGPLGGARPAPAAPLASARGFRARLRPLQRPERGPAQCWEQPAKPPSSRQCAPCCRTPAPTLRPPRFRSATPRSCPSAPALRAPPPIPAAHAAEGLPRPPSRLLPSSRTRGAVPLRMSTPLMLSL